MLQVNHPYYAPKPLHTSQPLIKQNLNQQLAEEQIWFQYILRISRPYNNHPPNPASSECSGLEVVTFPKNLFYHLSYLISIYFCRRLRNLQKRFTAEKLNLKQREVEAGEWDSCGQAKYYVENIPVYRE